LSTPAALPVPIHSVGQLVQGLKGLLEERVGRLWVVGEVSNLFRAASGHFYFTLKDDAAQIRAVLFRGAARQLPFEPEDGLEVLVYAEVSVYEPRGDLQLVVRQLEPRGDGLLRLQFEQLRRRLEAEGLFDPARKRGLPALPRALGVVTSGSGAALHDVLHVTGRRWPSLPILIAPTRVQGEGAELEIAAALDALAGSGRVDAVLLVRGGGSLEDLQAFNTEAVARAIARAPVPVVSGVGHEVDVTIADLVADQRAATPSAAAELATPDRAALRRSLVRDFERLVRAARAAAERVSARLLRQRDAVALLSPAARLAAQRTRLLALARALPPAIGATLAAGRGRLAAATAGLDGLSPLAVLARGYALVRRTRDGAIVRQAREVEPGETVSIRLAEGELEAAIERVR
jgi:exodeoxyribonuclease VII large subunit